ncbi:MAG: hypothetical protein ACYCYL_05065 [Acidithiobacillus sp.]
MGGGLVAVTYATVLILYHIPCHDILLDTIFPTLLSSVCISVRPEGHGIDAV